jgi:hypothetical protein
MMEGISTLLIGDRERTPAFYVELKEGKVIGYSSLDQVCGFRGLLVLFVLSLLVLPVFSAHLVSLFAPLVDEHRLGFS